MTTCGPKDDFVYMGDHGEFFGAVDRGTAADLVSFRDFCTPPPGWIWANWMRESWSNLTTPGRALETWVVAYRVSRLFLETMADKYALQGVSGHVEYLLPTVALREGLKLAFVSHRLLFLGGDAGGGPKACRTPGLSDRVGGSFSYCCRYDHINDAETWYQVRRAIWSSFLLLVGMSCSSSSRTIEPQNHSMISSKSKRGGVVPGLEEDAQLRAADALAPRQGRWLLQLRPL